jgi:hypothetical protein
MFRFSANSRVLSLLAIALLVAGVITAHALPLAGPNRPATVPAHYVITPYGYFDPSCVTHLAKGDILHKEKDAIEHANGTFDSMHVCAYPHYTGDGEQIIGDERAVQHEPKISHSWIEYASVTTSSSSYGEIYSEWNVPPAPSNSDGQTVYFFNGLEDYKDVVTIIQPVLGWNSDYSNAWGIASWNCCEKGSVFEAAPAPVSSGDLIIGLVYDNCSAGTKTCTSWEILTIDATNGNVSEYDDASNFGQTFNWAFGGVLEVYNIANCGDYPGGGGNIDFYEQYLYTDAFKIIPKPAWKVSNVSSGLTPQCSYGGALPEEVILSY